MTYKPKVPRKGTKTSRIPGEEAPRIRVRSKPLEQVDETKLALAFYLIAMQLVEDRTDAGEPHVGPDADEQAAGADERADAAGGAA